MKVLQWRELVCGAVLAVVLSGCGPSAEDLRNKGIAEYQIGRTEQARALLQMSLDLDPVDPEALYYMGRAMHTDEFYEHAIFYYQACLHVSPGHSEVQEWLSKATTALAARSRGPRTEPTKAAGPE